MVTACKWGVRNGGCSGSRSSNSIDHRDQTITHEPDCEECLFKIDHFLIILPLNDYVGERHGCPRSTLGPPPFRGMNDNVGGDEPGHANDEFLRAFGDKYGTGWSPEFPDPFRYCRREGFQIDA